MLTTVHMWNEVTLAKRRKPRSTSTNAVMVRKAFGDRDRMACYIPTVIDDYNHHMNGVDLADQRRAAYTTHQRTRRNWLALFFFLLDLSVTNAYLLFTIDRNNKLNQLIDCNLLEREDILAHPLSQPYSAELFRRILYKQLCASKRNIERHVRRKRYYTTKTRRFYFTKYSTRATCKTLPVMEVEASSSQNLDHHLDRLQKRRECAICRFDFRSMRGQRNGRKRPKLTGFECRTCSPPTALCKDGPCFTRWHHTGIDTA